MVGVVGSGGGRCDGLLGSADWSWEPGEAGERVGDRVSPGSGLGQAQPGASTVPAMRAATRAA